MKDFDTVFKENQGLIHMVCRKWSGAYRVELDYDDMFQIASMAFYRSYQMFDESKGMFTTYAGYNMYQALNKQYYRVTKRIDKTRGSSIDELILGLDKKTDVKDSIPALNNTEDEVVCSIIFKEVLNRLPENKRDMIVLYSRGYTQQEVAKMCNTNQVSVSRLCNKVKNILLGA